MSDDETKELLRALGRAVEREAGSTRYVIAAGFLAVVITLIVLLA